MCVCSQVQRIRMHLVACAQVLNISLNVYSWETPSHWPDAGGKARLPSGRLTPQCTHTHTYTHTHTHTHRTMTFFCTRP